MCTVLVVLAQCPCCEQSVNVSNDYGHVKVEEVEDPCH